MEHPENRFSPRTRRWLAGGAVAVLVVFFLLTGYLVGRPLIRFVSQPEAFRAWIDEFGIWARVAYVGMVLLQVVVALIPGEPLEIGGGYAFGAVEGTGLCLIGATLGSIIVFAAVRRWGIRLVDVFFDVEKINRLPLLRDRRRRDFLFFLLFLLPGTPKDLLCYAAGLTPMSWPTWLLICTVGRLPSVITSMVGGSSLGGKKYLLSAIVFGGTLLLSLLGVWLFRRLEKKRDGHAGPEQEEKGAPPKRRKEK